MKNMQTRSVLSKRNFAVSAVTRLVGMIISFASRTIFVKNLPAEYLGLGGFFGNIFAVVSLCELGFGAAISQSLYKPLSENDKDKISAIITYFSKIYKIIAVITLVLSMCAFPFLTTIVKTSIDTKQIYCAYFVFCVHVFLSYLLSPKCSLVVCDQRMYITSAVRCALGVVAFLIQSIVLVTTKSYFIYLCVRVVVIFISDVIINIYADKKYPYINDKRRVSKEYKREIRGKVKALIWHKAGAVLNRNTDSLLLSSFVGLSGLGKYSNYALIIGTIGAFFDVAMNAVAASVGNLTSRAKSDASEAILRKMYFINFCLVTVSTCLMVCILNPFIYLWLGEYMLFTNAQMLVIVASFYFSCIRDPVQIFLNAMGLFKQSRFIPVMRALLNLVFSLCLVSRFGVSGVFAGTILSTVAVPLVFEVLVLYKHGLHKKSTPLLIEMCKYIFISFSMCALCFLVTLKLPYTLTGLALRAAASVTVSCAALYGMYCNSSYYKYAKKLILGRIASKKR